MRVLRMNIAADVMSETHVPPVTAAATGLPRARLRAAEASKAVLVAPAMVATVGADTVGRYVSRTPRR
jgi:hypothetical protein